MSRSDHTDMMGAEVWVQFDKLNMFVQEDNKECKKPNESNLPVGVTRVDDGKYKIRIIQHFKTKMPRVSGEPKDFYRCQFCDCTEINAPQLSISPRWIKRKNVANTDGINFDHQPQVIVRATGVRGTNIDWKQGTLLGSPIIRAIIQTYNLGAPWVVMRQNPVLRKFEDINECVEGGLGSDGIGLINMDKLANTIYSKVFNNKFDKHTTKLVEKIQAEVKKRGYDKLDVTHVDVVAFFLQQIELYHGDDVLIIPPCNEENNNYDHDDDHINEDNVAGTGRKLTQRSSRRAATSSTRNNPRLPTKTTTRRRLVIASDDESDDDDDDDDNDIEQGQGQRSRQQQHQLQQQKQESQQRIQELKEERRVVRKRVQVLEQQQGKDKRQRIQELQQQQQEVRSQQQENEKRQRIQRRVVRKRVQVLEQKLQYEQQQGKEKRQRIHELEQQQQQQEVCTHCLHYPRTMGCFSCVDLIMNSLDA